MDVIEKVARALCDIESDGECDCLYYVPHAIAAIKAMREAMQDDFNGLEWYYSLPSGSLNTMIDAALGEHA